MRLMLILQCIIFLLSQSVYFTNAFYQADIPYEKPVSTELPRYFKSDGGKCGVVLILNKRLYGPVESACL